MSTGVFVYTMNRAGEVGAWSRYLFPFTIDNFCHLADDLYIRAGDDVLVVDETASYDYQTDVTRQQVFYGVIQWPWLDFGMPGVTKMLAGVDLSGTSTAGPTIQVGTDQGNLASYTTAETLPVDSVPGFIHALPVMAPSFSVKLQYVSTDQWQVQALTVYLQDQRITA